MSGAIEHIIDWQGITLSVAYTPKGRIPVHHLEIRVLKPQGAALPVTATGYRSHFFDDDVAEFGGAIGYVIAWLDDAAAKTTGWVQQHNSARQMSLF